MKRIKPSANKERWPNKPVKSVECRKRDLVIRIADWTRQSKKSGEPAFDVEVYIGGVYSWNDSKTFTVEKMSKMEAKSLAAAFAKSLIEKFL